MENTLIQRVIEISSLKEKSHRSFAIAVGFNYTTFNNYIIGKRNTIDSLLIQRIASTYEDISFDWLLTGKGEMLKVASASPPISEGESIYKKLFEQKEAELANSRKRIEELIAHNAKLEQELTVFTSRKKTVQEWEIVAGAADVRDGTKD